MYDEKCPTASGFGKAGQHIPYIILEHCPCTDLFSFLVLLCCVRVFIDVCCGTICQRRPII